MSRFLTTQYTPEKSSFDNPIYKPLDKSQRETRILKLHFGNHDDSVCGTLAMTALQSDNKIVKYEAISYCWGDSTTREQITLNQFSFDAPASAAEALRHLRFSDQSRILWIDVLCINQHDVREREHQLTIMADVYRNATQTNIWLGKADEHTEDALEICRNVLELISLELRQMDYSDPDDYVRIATVIINMDAPMEISVVQLESLFRRP